MHRSYSIQKLAGLLLAAIVPGLLLAGCNLLPTSSTDRIQEPPLIPEPAADTTATPSEMTPKALVTAYADLIDFNDLSKHHPLLHDAVSTAIQVGVLKPASVTDTFNPQSPIQYGEFRTWAIAYLNATSTPPARSAETAPTETAGTPNPSPSTTNPMNPLNLIILPSEIQWGDHRLTDTHPITREELCALYVFLTQQETAARSLSADEIEATVPGQKQVDPDVANPDEALSQFKDWSAMDGWARRYVAVAYRDNLMKSLFGLTSTKLTVDEGFHPQQPLTREEAIVLLHSLYGQKALAWQAAHPATTNPPQASAASIPSDNLPMGAPSTDDKPQPISHLKTIHETGPNGTRSAIQVNGPE